MISFQKGSNSKIHGTRATVYSLFLVRDSFMDEPSSFHDAYDHDDSPSLFLRKISSISLTPSTSPTLATPPSQSTTTGQRNAFGFLRPISEIAARVVDCSPVGATGCADTKIDGSAAVFLPAMRYDRIVSSWSGFGGDSTTSKLNCSGPALDLPGGYGEVNDALSSVRALFDNAELGL